MAAWAPLQAAARGINPIESAIRQELGLESTKLPDGVRQRVEAAIQRNRYRITIGEAAAMAGVKLSEAETALKALAYDSSAVLEVSSDGDVVYSFDPGFQAAIRNKSVSLRVKPALKKAGTWALLAVRIAFGTTLIASILTTFIAISIVLSSSQRQSDDRDGRGGGGSGFRMSFFPSDLFFYWTPNYQSRRAAAVSEGSMSLPEAIFSFVFGDGDPNMDYDEKRWRALGRLIQNRNGVLTAEEMAPYLDPKPLTSDGVVDESVVLPALIKFGGEPFVDEDGQLLYKFPTLQKTVVQREVLGRPAPRASAWAMRGARPVRGVDEFGDDAVLQPQYEQRWEMTAAEPGQIAATIALGLINFVGVAVLGGLISDPATRMSLIREGFSWIPSIVPFLTTYAVSFFGIPLVRYVRNSFFNKGIDERNDAREAAARRVAAPDSRLARKLAKARAQGERKVITQRDIVYSSEKDAGQTNARDLEDFDARLGSGRAVRDDTPWLNTNVTSKQPVGRTREEDGW